MKIFGNCLGVTLFGIVVGFAQEKADPTINQAEGDLSKMVRVQVEFIEVPHETMTELLFEPRNSANDTPLRVKLQDLVKEGKAKMHETLMATAGSGNSATTESVHEFIYPIEYSAPGVPCDFKDKPSPVTNSGIPIAFETRNIGSTLEILPTIGENEKIIDLRLLPTLVYHTGNEVWYEETKGKDTYRVQMPNFYKVEVNTSATLIAGQPFLMAAVSPKDDKGEADFTKKILIFVRADVLTVGK